MTKNDVINLYIPCESSLRVPEVNAEQFMELCQLAMKSFDQEKEITRLANIYKDGPNQ